MDSDKSNASFFHSFFLSLVKLGVRARYFLFVCIVWKGGSVVLCLFVLKSFGKKRRKKKDVFFPRRRRADQKKKSRIRNQTPPLKEIKANRVFSRGRGGGRRPPPDFGGKRVPPRGGTHFDLGKKGYGGWLGSPAQTPIWDTTYVTRTRKKGGGQEVERARSASYPFLASL